MRVDKKRFDSLLLRDIGTTAVDLVFDEENYDNSKMSRKGLTAL